MTTDEDQPRVLGIKATVWTVCLALAVILGAGTGAWRGGLFQVANSGTVTTTTESAATPPASSTPARIVHRVPVIRTPVVVTVTDTSASSSSSRRALVQSTVTDTTTSTSIQESIVPKRTDCPDGMIPDDNGGCVVDHSKTDTSPPPPPIKGGDQGKPDGAGQGGDPGNAANAPGHTKVK